MNNEFLKKLPLELTKWFYVLGLFWAVCFYFILRELFGLRNTPNGWALSFIVTGCLAAFLIIKPFVLSVAYHFYKDIDSVAKLKDSIELQKAELFKALKIDIFALAFYMVVCILVANKMSYLLFIEIIALYCVFGSIFLGNIVAFSIWGIKEKLTKPKD